MSVDLPTPERALAIAAHPDDVEFQCGATLAKWAEAGCEVHHLICTDGSKGTWDPHADLARLVVTRQAEQRTAAARLGATGEVVFLGWPDGELEAGLRQRWEIAYWIRHLRPDVVLGHDPWKRYRLHPDHRAAGLLACDGVVAARDPHFFPEQAIAHHRPSALLLFEADKADHLEVVTLAQAEAKVTALLAHESQFETTMGISRRPADGGGATREVEQAAFHQRILDELAAAGAKRDVGLAERFKLIADL